MCPGLDKKYFIFGLINEKKCKDNHRMVDSWAVLGCNFCCFFNIREL